MKNSTLVYKSAIIILGIAWPFILPAHRFPSFYWKSCICWHWTLSISNSENFRVKFKGKRIKWKSKLIFFWISQKSSGDPQSACSTETGWKLRTISLLTSSQAEKIFWKEIIFHQWQHLSSLPVRSTAGWLDKLQNRIPIPSSSNWHTQFKLFSISFLAVIIARDVKQHIPLCLSWDRNLINLRIQSLLLNHGKVHHGRQTMMLEESGCTQTIHANHVVYTCPSFQQASNKDLILESFNLPVTDYGIE